MRKQREVLWNDFQPNYELVTQADGVVGCPLCLSRLTIEEFTIDHAPPRRLGGRLLVPVCRACNSKAGSKIENHFDRFLKRREFDKLYPGREPWTLEIDGKRVHSAIAADDRSINVIVRQDCPGSVHASRAVEERFGEKLGDGRWQGTSIELHSDRKLAYSSRYLDLAWFKAGYLAVLWFLGYGAILQPAYDRVRKQLSAPEEESLPLWVGGRTSLNSDSGVMIWYVHDPHPAFLVYFAGFKGGRDAAVLVPTPADEHLAGYEAAVAAMKPGIKLPAIGVPPDVRLRSNDGLTLISEDTNEEFDVY